MPKIEFSFSINLESWGAKEIHHYGPLFTRWLPDGKDDALSLTTKDAGGEIKIWFSRRGFVDNGFLEFDLRRHEVDPTIMARQAILEAGPLSGVLILTDVTEEELLVIEHEKIGDPVYIDLGKRIVSQIWVPVSQVIRLLRENYGQYWIRELPIWDSRLESLGSYCTSRLELRWWSNPNSAWRKFCPTDPLISFQVKLQSIDHYKQYISQEDYFKIPKTLTQLCGSIPSSAILLSASENFDLGNLSYAIIEACTALEISISTYVREKLGKNPKFKGAISDFFSQKKETQLIFLASLGSTDIAEDDLDLAIQGINLRNQIVHEGFEPFNSEKNVARFLALRLVTVKLLSGTFYRFPSANPGNAIFPEVN